MVISEKQHQANLRNAQKSTGPRTPEGKAKCSMNALKHGLRASRTPISSEYKEAFERLCDALEEEWQPQSPTEQDFLETMATSQWLLARLTSQESMVYELLVLNGPDSRRELALLDYYSRLKVRLERSFAKAVRDLQQFQKDHPRQPQPEAAEAGEPAEAPAPSPQPEWPQAAEPPMRPEATDTR